MAYGIKKILCVILVLATFFMVASCDKRDVAGDLFDEVNAIFFKRLLSGHESDKIVVNSMDAYYYEGCYYYNASVSSVSSISGEWMDYEFVYIGSHWTNITYINLNWPDNNWENATFANRRARYYLAVENAEEHKIFSQEEIQRYIDEYYASKETSK